MKNGQFPAVIQLADLNGQNGFKIDGENPGDESGYSVSAAGDINSDGYADLLIGAGRYQSGSYKGRSYVVFGGLGIGGGGIFNLSNLNGNNGFKLDGEGGGSGLSSSIAGDVNGDGWVDLIIGALGYNNSKGRSYVVFGGPQVGNGGIFSLTSLNGTNGFKFDGENNNDQSGWSVSAAGDINDDGYADLIVGANEYLGGAATGRSYVIFGGPNISNNGLFALSSLNGTLGFKLNGENADDYSGSSVGTVGDINGDSYVDIMIGANAYNSARGRAYVMFGGPTVGNQGLLNLSNLTGTNGFKLDGEASGVYTGNSIGTAGDVNGDGYVDLMIGAATYNGSAGRSYVIFGGSGIGTSGLLPLSILNGLNGFKLDGEQFNDYSGIKVSTAGDFNGDEYADLLIGAAGTNLDATQTTISPGKSYVIFGGTRVGNSGLFKLANLDGSNGFKLIGEVSNDLCGGSLSAAGDINGDGIGDILIGAYNHSSGRGRTYVVFGDAPPVLVNNSLSLSVGAAITLNSTFLAAYDRNHNNNTLVFVPSVVTHGQFEVMSAPGIPLGNFTQQQVAGGTIQFIHDGSLVSPRYDITVRSDGIAWTGPVSAKINFIGAPQSYFPAMIPLVSLNGQNGFKIDGENTGDQAGFSLNTAGDINSDGYADLVIGAIHHTSSRGRSYVIFGGPNVGAGGKILLSSLNGTDGFKLDGETNGDFSGWSVSSAGDVNSDGKIDFMISAQQRSSLRGRTYVIFGNVNVGKTGMILLSGLNGTNGFKLDGEQGNDWSGQSVCSVNDLNGDGHTDLLLSAYNYLSGDAAGRSYLVFGGSNIGQSSILSLSSLNGTNGFKLDGEASDDQSGVSVTAGDVNGDGYADLLIGAHGHASNTGRSYLVFGGTNVGSNSIISLSSLNGTNGFKLAGETVGDFCGGSVSIVGDINGDDYADLLIAAQNHASNTGRSYVVFGSSNIGAGGIISLSNLNGTNGFKLDGEFNDDYSGCSVSTAGDINGDGYADLLIGACGYAGDVGCSYVVFGGSGVGSNGTLALSSLTGANGFKLDGEAMWDNSGLSVNSAGDINGDGVMDILIGSNHNSLTGRTYVVFGDAPPTLVQNRLYLGQNQTIRLNTTFLSAYDRNHDNNSIVFFPTNVMHGYFERTVQLGTPLTNFTQPQLGSGTIQFVHDGSTFAPSYNITVRSDGIAWTGPHPANIAFIPAITTTTTAIPTTTIATTSTPLPTTATPTPTPIPSTSTPVMTSTPSFTPTPSVTTIAPTPSPTSTPTPTPLTPIVLVNNQLTFNNGGQVILSPVQLQASKAGYDNNQLTFLIGDVQNGYFTLTAQNTTRLMTFTQAQIDSGDITFVHTGDGQAPSYQVMVTDGVQYTAPDSPTIYFIDAPIITENTLTLQPGEIVTLTPSNLNVTITDGSTLEQVICRVTDLQYAVITQLPSGLPVSNFTLADLQSGKIQVMQDNNNYAAVSYTLSCGGQKGMNSVPSTVDTHFSYQGVKAPQLLNNYLLISQGGSVPLTTENIHATQNGSDPLARSAFFYISEVVHGHFGLQVSPDTVVTFFSQEQLQNGSVIFTQDNSKVAPGYRLSVRALGLESARLPAAVIFRPVNQPPKLLHALTDQSATVGKTFSYAIPPDTFADPEGEVLELSVSRFNSSLSLPSWLKFDGLNNRFMGIPPIDDFIDINVTAKDPQGLSATTDFVLKVTPAATQETGFSTWEKTIIGALISGSIGIGFVLVQICMKRAANKKLMQILGQGDTAYERDVVRPVMKDITGRIKISRFMNAITNKELMAFKGAVRSLLSALERRQVDINFSEMKESKKDEVINEIGHQTFRWMKTQQRGCAKCCPGMHAFFKPQLTAEALQEGVEEIADNVVRALQKPAHKPQPSLSTQLLASGNPVYQEHKNKRSVELSEIDSPSKKGGEREELPEPAAAQLG